MALFGDRDRPKVGHKVEKEVPDPVGLKPPSFDSGFLPVPTGGKVSVGHGLNTIDLIVELQSRLPDGTITSKGSGATFWYEIPNRQEIRVARSGDGDDLEIRVILWPSDVVGAKSVSPVANAGRNRVVEFGSSFMLDASQSKAFGGRKLVRFVWTQFS